MPRLKYLAAIAALVFSSAVARADTISPFAINGSGETIAEGEFGQPNVYSPGLVVGTTSIDITTGTILNFQVSFTDEFGGSFALGTPVTPSGPIYANAPLSDENPYGPYFFLSNNTPGATSFADFIIGGFYYDGADRHSGSSRLFDTYSAEISPEVAATPEPSTIALVGTGIVGMLYMMVRRRRAADSWR